jgi:ubiquinone/menaquinone biosynthesis C-methylase UbiE
MSSGWDKYWSSPKIDFKIMEVWAKQFVSSFKQHFGFSENDVILDYAAGRGDIAYLIREKVKRIYLYDSSEYMKEHLTQKFDGSYNVTVFNTLDELKEKVSVIIFNSVFQYFSADKIENLFDEIMRFCTPETRIIISDIVPPGYSKIKGFFSQLRISFKKKYSLALIRYAITSVVNYPLLSLSSDSLADYDEKRLMDLLKSHYFRAERMEDNFTFSKLRYTLVCYLDK